MTTRTFSFVLAVVMVVSSASGTFSLVRLLLAGSGNRLGWNDCSWMVDLP